MLASFTKPFLFAAAFMLAMFGTSILPATAASAQNNNGGNDGFIKVNGSKFDDIPNNEPHVGCKFTIEFYNYDRGTIQANVDFELQNPTKGAGYSLDVTGGNLNPFIGEDGGNGSNDLDAIETYTLGFTGVPHPNQGYKVKLTITAPGTNGNDTKTKVFWVEPCAKPDATATPTACTDRSTGTGTVVVNVANPNVSSVNYTVKLGSTTKQVTVAGGSDQNVTFTGIAPGTYTITIEGDDGSKTKTLQVKVDECNALNPTILANSKACNDPFNTIFTGELEVSVTNNNYTQVTYKVTVGNTSKTLVVAGQATEKAVFTGLSNGFHTIIVEGNDKTSAQTQASIDACSPIAPDLKIKDVTCSYNGYAGIGSATIEVTNLNSYVVTYQITLEGTTQTVTVSAGATQSVTFTGLNDGSYTATLTASNNTSGQIAVSIPACTSPVVPTTPGQTLGTSTTKVTLPKTGSEGTLTALLAILAAVTTYVVALLAQKRFANNTK